MSVIALVRKRFGSVAKGVGLLAFGSAFAQLMTIAASPIITRLFSTDAIGLFGTFLNVSAVVTAVASLKFEQAILLEREEEGALSVARLCMAVGLGVAITFAAVMLIFRPLVVSQFGEQMWSWLLFATTPWIILTAIYNVIQNYNLRIRRYGLITQYNMTRSIGSSGLQIGLGLALASAIWLPVGQVAGQFLGVLLALFLMRPLPAGLLRPAVRKDLLKTYSSFPIFGAPQSFLNGFSNALPTSYLLAAYSGAEAGLYWLAYRILTLPNIVLVESIRSYLISIMSERLRQGKPVLREFYVYSAVCFGMCALAVPVLVLWGDVLFGFVFGAGWEGAGTYAAILSFGWALQNAAVPASVVIVLAKRQRAYLVMEAALLGIKMLALSFYAFGGPTEAVAGLTILNAIHAIAVIIYGRLVIGSAQIRQ